MKPEFRKYLDGKIEKGLIVVGAYMQGKAAGLCPVKTANLVNSITYSTSTQESNVNGKTNGTPLESPEKHSVKIGSNVVYAKRVEFGFSGQDSLGRSYNQPGTPFLRGALLSNMKEATILFNRVLNS